MAFAFFLLLPFYLLIYIVDSEFFRLLHKEDHFLENCTVLFLLCTVTLGVILLRRAGTRHGGTVPWLLILGFGFWALEEISFGQRIFSFDPPDFFKTHNLQNEMNIHNLSVLGMNLSKDLFSKAGGFILISHFIILPVAARYKPILKEHFEAWMIPVPSLPMISGFALALITGVLLRATGVLNGKSSYELSEFASSVVYFVLYFTFLAKFQQGKTSGWKLGALIMITVFVFGGILHGLKNSTFEVGHRENPGFQTGSSTGSLTGESTNQPAGSGGGIAIRRRAPGVRN